METTTETVAEILRPLVERKVPCPIAPVVYHDAETIMDEQGYREVHLDGGHAPQCQCGGTGLAPDKRFDALRCFKYEEVIEFVDGSYDKRESYGIRTDLGSIVRAMAACGLFFVRLHGAGPTDNPFIAVIAYEGDVNPYIDDATISEPTSFKLGRGKGTTPELAASRAFAATVGVSA